MAVNHTRLEKAHPFIGKGMDGLMDGQLRRPTVMDELLDSFKYKGQHAGKDDQCGGRRKSLDVFKINKS